MAVRLLRGTLLLGLLVLAAPARGDEGLEERIAGVLKTPGYQDGHWGLLIVDATSGRTLYERNADQLFCPASVTKLYSTAAALVDLGADHRFQTPVVRRGEVDPEGTLRGDLVLIAQGDLCLGGRTGPEGTLLFEDHDHTYAGGNFDATLVPSDPLAGLDHLAREIKAAGINAVRGDVLVDDRLFEPAPSTGSGPSRLSPIMVNDNVIDVVATPAEKAGTPAHVRIVPETDFVTMEAEVDTVEADKSPRLTVRAVGPRRFMVRGRLPLGHKPVVKIYEVEEPASFARALFITALRRRGVHVEAAAIGRNDAEHLPPRERRGPAPQGRRVHLAPVPGIRAGDPQGEPQPAREHAAALDRRASRGDDAGGGPEARGHDPQGARGRCRDHLVRRRSRGGAFRPGHAPRHRRAVAGDGGAARVPRLRRRAAGPGPRRHAGQGRRLRQPRAGSRSRQDRHLHSRQRPAGQDTSCRPRRSPATWKPPRAARW